MPNICAQFERISDLSIITPCLVLLGLLVDTLLSQYKDSVFQ